MGVADCPDYRRPHRGTERAERSGWRPPDAGCHEQASDHFGRALRIAQDIGFRVGELYALNGLGGAHWMLGRYEQAVGCYQKVLDPARSVRNSNWQFEALQGLGRLRHATGHPDLALTHH